MIDSKDFSSISQSTYPVLLLKIILENLSLLARRKNIELKIINQINHSYRFRTDIQRFINIFKKIITKIIDFANVNQILEILIQNNENELFINLKIKDSTTREFKLENSKNINESFSDIILDDLSLLKGTIQIENEELIGLSICIKLPKNKDIGNIERNLISNILVIEDNVINQMLMKKILENEGYNVMLANDGIQGFEAYQSNDFEIIFMDLMMPRLNGYKTTQKIRFMEDKKKSKIPIIAISSDVSLKIKERCFAFGMNDYIAKPFNKEIVLEMITKYSINSKS